MIEVFDIPITPITKFTKMCLPILKIYNNFKKDIPHFVFGFDNEKFKIAIKNKTNRPFEFRSLYFGLFKNDWRIKIFDSNIDGCQFVRIEPFSTKFFEFDMFEFSEYSQKYEDYLNDLVDNYINIKYTNEGYICGRHVIRYTTKDRLRQTKRIFELISNGDCSAFLEYKESIDFDEQFPKTVSLTPPRYLPKEAVKDYQYGKDLSFWRRVKYWAYNL